MGFTWTKCNLFITLRGVYSLKPMHLHFQFKNKTCKKVQNGLNESLNLSFILKTTSLRRSTGVPHFNMAPAMTFKQLFYLFIPKQLDRYARKK